MSVPAIGGWNEKQLRRRYVAALIQAKLPAIRRANLREILSQQLLRNMASGPAATVLVALLTAVTYPIYLYYLGFEGYGLWVILGTVPSLAQFGNLGIAPAITTLVAAEFGKQNPVAITEYVSTALIGLAGSGVIAVVAIVLLRGSLIVFLHLPKSAGTTLMTMIPFCALLAVYVFQVEALIASLSGLGRIDIANYARALSAVICLTSAVLYFRLQLGIVAPVLASATSYMVLHLVTVLSIRAVLGRPVFLFSGFRRARIRPLLQLGGGMFGCSAAGLILVPFNRLLLARFTGLAALPIYDIALNGSMQFRAVVESAIRATMPEISRLSSTLASSAAAIRRVTAGATRFVWILGTPMYAVLYLGARPLLRLWLHSRFLDAMPASFRIMLLGSFVSLLGVPAFYTLVAIGRIRDVVLGSMIQAGVNALIVCISIFLFSRADVSLFLWATAIGMGAGAFYLIRADARQAT